MQSLESAYTQAGQPINALAVYLPLDRRRAAVAGTPVPEHTSGSVLFADISGFTPMTAALVRYLGPQRGAEEMSYQLNLVYDALIAEVHCYGGSVIGFSGDAITCWLEGDDGTRATLCGLAMQQAMQQFQAVTIPSGETLSIAMKAAVATGSVRRFLVGDPAIQVIDVLAGSTLEHMAAAEHLANRGEVVLAQTTLANLRDHLTLADLRTDATNQQFGVVQALHADLPPEALPGYAPNAPPETPGLRDEHVSPWLLPPVYERLKHGQEHFLAEMRPTVALFLRFQGIDYDTDPEAGSKLNAFICHVQHILARYEGFLIQVTLGDKGSYLYSAFGAPLAHDDDPLRAVSVALHLHDLPPHLHYIRDMQMGISRGQMRTGAYGSIARRSTYGVLGDEVNVAARLMTSAQPGQIIVSKAVMKATHQHYRFDEQAPIRVKGKSDPLPIALLRPGQTADFSRAVSLFRPSTPADQAAEPAADRMAELSTLVGREAEVARLDSLLAALHQGQGGVLVLQGEAGIGKSRLVAELAHMMHQQGIAGLMGAGQSIEQQTPYRAWRDIFTAYFGLDQTETATGLEALAALQQQTTRLLESRAPEHLERLPLLNDMLNLNFPVNSFVDALDPALRQQNLTILLTALLRAQASLHPCVILLEDVQWLDSLSWDLTVQAVRALLHPPPHDAEVPVPILFVLVSRPLEDDSLAAEQASYLKTLPETVWLHLTELTAAAIRRLTAQRLGVAPAAIPSEVATLIHERSDGNPFVAEELVLTLRDQGIIALERDETAPAESNGHSSPPLHCVVRGDLKHLAQTLPDTVQGLILARLDRLTPELQLPLKVGAVVSRDRDFDYATLLHALQQQQVAISDAELKQALTQLTSLDLTVPGASETNSFHYLFKHIITKDVAYQTLLYSQRRELHSIVARWYEDLYRQQHTGQTVPSYELLYYHYKGADEPASARLYARLAGEQAAAKFANPEAIDYLSQALALTPENETSERYAMLLIREQVYDLQGDRNAQGHDLDTLQALAEAADNPEWQAEIALRRANYAEKTSDYPQAIHAARRAIKLARTTQSPASKAEGYLLWGIALWRQGIYNPARVQLKSALTLARKARIVQVEADSLRNLGNVARDQGRHEDAQASYAEALALSRETNDRLGESKALNNLGTAAHDMGQYAEAATYYQQTLALSRDIGDRQGESKALNNLGILAQDQQQYASARDYFEQALALCYETRDRQGGAIILTNLGRVCILMGLEDESRRYNQQAVALAEKIGNQLIYSQERVAGEEHHKQLRWASDYRSR